MDTIKKININGHEYDIEDSSARITLSELQQSLNGYIPIGGAEVEGDYKFDGILTADGIYGYIGMFGYVDVERGTLGYIDIQGADVYKLDVHKLCVSYITSSDLYANNIRNWTLETDLGYSYISISYSPNKPAEERISVKTTGKFLYNDSEVITDASARLLPKNYVKGSDDLLYVEKECESVVPVSHPDYSTQASVLPQRFGSKKIYEVMIPLVRKTVLGNPYLDDDQESVIKNLHWLYNQLFNHRCTVTDYSTNKNFGTACLELEFHQNTFLSTYRSTDAQNSDFTVEETFSNCVLVRYAQYLELWFSDIDLMIDITDDKLYYDRRTLSSTYYERYRQLYTDVAIKKLPCIIIPVKVHYIHKQPAFYAHNFKVEVSEDVYFCRPSLDQQTIDSGSKKLCNDLFFYIKWRTPDYNLKNIPDFDFFEDLSNIVGNTIVDAKLIGKSGVFSPAQVFARPNNMGDALPICIKEVVPFAANYYYDYCLIQYVDNSSNSYSYGYGYSYSYNTITNNELLKYVTRYDTYNNTEIKYVDMGEAGLWSATAFGSNKPNELKYNQAVTWADANNFTDYNPHGFHPYYNNPYAIFDDKTITTLSKYNSDDLKYEMDLDDDIVCKKMGSNRIFIDGKSYCSCIPRAYDFMKLMLHCAYYTYYCEGIEGQLFISRQNGNKIFLPFSYNDPYYSRPQHDEIFYWTSTLDQSYISHGAKQAAYAGICFGSIQNHYAYFTPYNFIFQSQYTSNNVDINRTSSLFVRPIFSQREK